MDPGAAHGITTGARQIQSPRHCHRYQAKIFLHNYGSITMALQEIDRNNIESSSYSRSSQVTCVLDMLSARERAVLARLEADLTMSWILTEF